MSLNESIVEDAALAMPRATLIPAFSRGEKGKREAIRRLNPAIPEEARATIRQFRIVHTERRIKL